LKIIVNNNSSLEINYFNIIDELDTNINIDVSKESSFTLNHSFINRNTYNLNIKSNFLSEESSINVNIHAINDGGKSKIDIDGLIKAQKINNNLMENIRVYNINGGKCESMPKMYIDTSKVIANHNVTISNLRDDELFYLNSKGINSLDATKLLCNGFLVKIINDDVLKTKVKEILIRR
jgi:Fe-S cluster assembly scaffold protein SufB